MWRDKTTRRNLPHLRTMLDESNSVLQTLSLFHCDARFGCYGMFATLPLHTAVITSNTYDHTRFHLALLRCFQNQCTSGNLTSFIRTLDFPDSEFFTFEEFCFLMQTKQVYLPRTQQQLTGGGNRFDQWRMSDLIILLGGSMYQETIEVSTWLQMFPRLPLSMMLMRDMEVLKTLGSFIWTVDCMC